MREFKFRAWHKQAKEMLTEKWDGQCLAFLSEGQPVEVMQYTGLKDKNGKEIYEGDIIKNHWLNIRNEQIGSVHLVKFGEYSDARLEHGSSGHIGFYAENMNKQDLEDLENPLNGLPSEKGIEIIGNIYQNPELLEESK